MKLSPIDVTKYLLYKCSFYGDVITNLKMQKLLYYVYAWCLVKTGSSCFEEKFQAWPNGPVLPSVYHELKVYGASPIDPDFTGLETKDDLRELEVRIGRAKELIDKVFEKYGALSAFQLVSLTHNELSWKNARKGLEVDQPSMNEIADRDILIQYDEKK